MERDPSTIVAHDDAWPYGAVVPPIVQTSLFTFGSYQELEDAMAGRARAPIYSRGDNPTVQAFEAKVAALEGAAAARAFASGMAAISGAVLSNIEAGQRMLCVRHCYPDAYRLFTTVLPRFDIAVEFVDGRDAAAIERALPGARILYLESPTSMVFETQDLPRLAAAARAAGALTIADNSWASPIFQRPLAHGVDLVLHSASKYLGGHSDTVAGVVCGSEELIGRINAGLFPLLGAKLSPFEGWLLLRGLRTLPLRLRRHHESGLEIAAPARAASRGQAGAPSSARRPRPGARHACGRLRPVQLRSRRRQGRGPPLLRCAAAVQARGQLGRAREPGLPRGGRPRAAGGDQPLARLPGRAGDRSAAHRAGRSGRTVVGSRPGARARPRLNETRRQPEMRASLTKAALTSAALALLAGPAAAETTLQLVEVITSPQRTEVLRGMVDQFEAANPEVKVEITSLPWGQAFEKLATMVQGGQIPDVVEMPDRWLALYANNDQLVDLGPYMANWDEGA